MPSARAHNRLHRSRYADFLVWLDEHGIPHRPGAGPWQIQQVRWGRWVGIYERASGNHLWFADQLAGLVRQFVKDRT